MRGISAGSLSWLIGPCLLALLLLTALIYAPGLHGPFLFDDYANLPQLGELGGIRDLPSLWSYLLGNTSGPTGRPLSMASFVLNDVAWPSDPFAFKWTNLCLHLLNGVLLFGFARSLLATHPHSAPIALFVSAAWLLNPLFVSATLYVVQRMAILAATMCLAGLWAYCAARKHWQTGPWRAPGLLVLVGGSSALAVSAKENGALLPLLILLVETLWLGSLAPPLRMREKLLVFAPTAGVVAAYLLWFMLTADWERAYLARDFTVAERLLTQARALWSYLFHWLWPWSTPTGLYADTYPASRGFLQPAQTALAVLALATTTILLFHLRRRQKPLALAGFFFLVAHMLESSVWPLELYFEHRNYLPAVLLAMPFAVSAARPGRQWLVAILLAWLLASAHATRERASLWADELTLKLSWHQSSPASLRAAADLSALLAWHSEPALAARVIAYSQLQQKPRADLLLLEAIYRCQAGDALPAPVEKISAALGEQPFSVQIAGLYPLLAQTATKGQCPQLTLGVARAWLRALESNPHLPKRSHLQAPLYWAGVLALRDNRAELAREAFADSLRYGPSRATAFRISAVLASHGETCMAREQLLQAQAIPVLPRNSLGHGAIDYAAEFQRLDALLKQDIAQRNIECP